MSGIREEIRAILREEISALRSEHGPAPVVRTERVRIASDAEVNRFALDVARRASDPDFVAQLTRGEMRFELMHDAPSVAAPIVSGAPRAEPEVLDKALITERDIATLNGARGIRIGPNSRLTPLARDEAQRKGIRIERTER